MQNQQPADWSPADAPYAIAVSEGQWWRWAVQLAIARLAEPDDYRFVPISTRQLDARNLVLALAQLLRAEALEQAAPEGLGVDASVGHRLSAARARFLADLDGIEDMRNALTHYDEWSRGLGQGPQKRRRAAGDDPRDVARDYWGFRYDPAAEAITFGPYRINTSVALRAATDLSAAIYSPREPSTTPGESMLYSSSR